MWLYGVPSKAEFLRRLFRCGKIVAGCIAGFLLLYFLVVLFTLPNVDDIGALFAAESTVITDRNGIELYRIHGDEDRTFIPLAQIALPLKQATIALEDARFYERGCFDPRAFFRAALRNVLGGFGSQGGSTITQQFVKNALIGSRKKRITRKIKEYLLSCRLEQRYSKDQILEMYLNRIPYGSNVHGAEQAARTYFAKSASGLTLAESAVLAVLPQLPSYFSPYGPHVRTTLSEKGERRLRRGTLRGASDLRDDDFWIGLVGTAFGSGGTLYIGGRTDQVLKNMEEQGFITALEHAQALRNLQFLTFQRERENIRAPHFVFAVRDDVTRRFGGQFQEGFLERGGLKIVTTLDWKLQEAGEGAVQEASAMAADIYGAHNAALIAADVARGEILAYVGNRDYWDEANDGRVDIVRSPRQPGSSFKPFVYASAFMHGLSPATILYDIPTKIGEDAPDNFDRTFWGPLTIRRALGASRNIPAAKAFFLAGGEDAITSLVSQMGVPSVEQRRTALSREGHPYAYGWPLALGAAEVPLFEMVQGYLTFARGGHAIPLTAILRIEDHLGNILYQAPAKPEERDVLDPRIAYMITSVLSDETVRPTEYWRNQLTVPGFQTAAKTGTSNKCLKRAPKEKEEAEGKCVDLRPDNNWTIGFTPEIIAGTWVGNASGGAMYVKASGLDTASHIWHPFMVAAQKRLQNPQTTFVVPPGIVSREISELSGKLASPCTPVWRRRAEIFLEEQAPTEFDDSCAEAEVDKLTGLLASDECPADARDRGFFFRPHDSFAEEFPSWERAVMEWAQDLVSGTGSIFHDSTGRRRGSGAFLPLPLPLLPTEKCRLALTPGRLTQPTVQILSPTENDPALLPAFVPRLSFTVGQAVREVRYELDGRPIALMSSGSSLTLAMRRTEGAITGPPIRVPRRFETGGTHTLKVILTDSYYNLAEDTVRFTFESDIRRERPPQPSGEKS